MPHDYNEVYPPNPASQNNGINYSATPLDLELLAILYQANQPADLQL